MGNCGTCHPKCMLEHKSVLKGSWVAMSWKADVDGFCIHEYWNMKYYIWCRCLSPVQWTCRCAFFQPQWLLRFWTWRRAFSENCSWRPSFLSFSNFSFDWALLRKFMRNAASDSVMSLCAMDSVIAGLYDFKNRWIWPVSSVDVVCRLEDHWRSPLYYNLKQDFECLSCSKVLSSWHSGAYPGEEGRVDLGRHEKNDMKNVRLWMKCRSEWQDFDGFGEFGKVLKNEDNLTSDLFFADSRCRTCFFSIEFHQRYPSVLCGHWERGRWRGCWT